MARILQPTAPRWKWFTPDLVGDLKVVVGEPHAYHLLPGLDDAADDMRRRQRDGPWPVEAISETLRKQVRNHAKVAKRIETLTGRLLRELEQASAVIRAAVGWRYLPGGYDPSGVDPLHTIMFGPKTTEPRQPVSDIRVTLETLWHDARKWEKEVHAASKGQRGRKSVRERVLLAMFVGNKLAAIGIPLIKSPDGAFAKVLEIVYDAAGIPNKPTDLYRDVAAALDHPPCVLVLGRR